MPRSDGSITEIFLLKKNNVHIPFGHLYCFNTAALTPGSFHKALLTEFMGYDKFTESVIKIIKGIPGGKVLSYGTIADMAGNPGGGRQVSWILHSMSEKHNLPWWRIVNSKGIISMRPGEGRDFQRAKLEKEGVKFIDDYRIDPDSEELHRNSAAMKEMVDQLQQLIVDTGKP